MDELVVLLYSIGFWILLAISLTLFSSNKELKKELQHKPETEKQLQEESKKRAELIDKQLKTALTKGKTNIKVPTKRLSNALKAFNGSFVNLSIVDICNLRLSDSNTEVKIPIDLV